MNNNSIKKVKIEDENRIHNIISNPKGLCVILNSIEVVRTWQVVDTILQPAAEMHDNDIHKAWERAEDAKQLICEIITEAEDDPITKYL